MERELDDVARVWMSGEMKREKSTSDESMHRNVVYCRSIVVIARSLPYCVHCFPLNSFA